MALPQHSNAAAAAPDIALVTRARLAATIREFTREAWNACFPNELEDYDYLLALETANIPNFMRRYAVVEENGAILAAMPVFFTDYPLDTTLDAGMVRDMLRSIRRRFARFLVLKLACFGAPEIERGIVGFHPSVTPTRRVALLNELVAGFEDVARREGYSLFGAKDIPDEQLTLWVAATPNYSTLEGMATAWMPIDFTDIDAYFARLSKETRKDMRRKLKTAEAIRIEERTEIEDVLPQIVALYRDTRARSEHQFEELTADYFRNVMRSMPGRTFCTLYYHGEELLGANLLLRDGETLLDKFFCMDGVRGREFNLYFLSWFTNLNYCLAHRLTRYQSGQAGYETKLRLGSQLSLNWMRFRHRHRFVNHLLKRIAPLLAMGDSNDQ
jgi:predicted N-acyltransferase